MEHVLFAIISISISEAVTSATPSVILCRSCTHAKSLADCGSMLQCDYQFEDCYMDQIITDSFTVVYNAGCRSKDVCSPTGLGIGRRDLVACQKCCNSADLCNDRLCSIHGTAYTTLPPATVRQTRSCYSCNNVRSLAECTTITQCDFQTDECYTESIVTDNMAVLFDAGCRAKSVCGVMGKKRDIVSCSSCCNQTDKCNGVLCNFKNGTDNSCQPLPCKNGGVCEKLPGTFHCHCAAGYMGRTCDLDFDECQYQPCYNGGTCVNFVGGFNCSCPSGFLGHKCETHADCSSVDAMPCWQLYSLRKCSRTHTIADACMKTKCDKCKVEFGQGLVG